MQTTAGCFEIQITDAEPRQVMLVTEERVYRIGGWQELDDFLEVLQYARAQIKPIAMS